MKPHSLASLLLPLLALLPRADAISFGDWRAAHFTAAQLADPAVSGSLADPDGDGFGNLLEFGFALDPWSCDTLASQPTLGLASGHLTLSYRQRIDAENLLFDFQISDTLLNWITVNELVFSTTNLGSAWWKTLYDPVPAAGSAQRFLRLRVLDATGLPTLFFPPSDARVSLDIPIKARVEWTDNTTVETGYLIERKTGAGPYVVIAITAADVNRFIDSGVGGSTTYTYRISAIQGGSLSAASNEATLTTPLDSDGDGLPDDWESQHHTNAWLYSTNGSGISDGYLWSWGMDPNIYVDPDSDADGDGLTLGEEAQLGTNPNSADTNGDGIPDGADTAPGGQSAARKKTDEPPQACHQPSCRTQPRRQARPDLDSAGGHTVRLSDLSQRGRPGLGAGGQAGQCHGAQWLGHPLDG